MSEGRKRTRSSTNNNLTSEMSEGRKRTRRSTNNDQPTDFIHHSQQKCLFLTEDNKVVKFGEKKISVKEYQQAEGIVWNTWVDYFFPKDKSHGNHLVTLTQKSGNTFRVLTKDTLKDTLKSVSYKMENRQGANREHPPNTIQEVGKNLEHHLFVMHTKASGKSMLQCYKSKAHFLHVSNKSLVLDRAASSNETGALFRLS